MKSQKNKEEAKADVKPKKGVKKIASAVMSNDNIEEEVESHDGECIGEYLATDDECKKCWIADDCKEVTNDKRKNKKTK